MATHWKRDRDDAWFETQYNARATVPDFAEIFARGEDASRRARLSQTCYLDVPYGAGAGETLDVFTSRGASRALLVFIHGGYWRLRDKADFSFIAQPFSRAGVTTVLVNYALCPQVTIEHIVRQMLKAHAWLWRNAESYGADRSRLFTSGHSAGGHLAAMMVACDWPQYERDLPVDLIKGALAISGIYDVVPLLRTGLNVDLRLDDNAARVVSPVTYRPARAVPLYTAVGGQESEEFRRQNRLLAQCWPHCFVRDVPMPLANHFTIVEALADERSALFQAAQEMMGIERGAG